MSRKKTKFRPILVTAFVICSALYTFFNPQEQASGDNSSSTTSISTPTPFSESYLNHVNPLKDFTEAKQAARHIFSDHRRTFYCGCKFDKHNHVELSSCGYTIQGDLRRARRLEWEHIVPVSHLSFHRPCWKKKLCCKEDGHPFGGRQCCREIDPDFCKMEADLHNIVPEIGELNALRSNYRFGNLPFISSGQFGECEIKIDPVSRRVEPRPEVRGIIARAYLYMSTRYHMELSHSQEQLFKAWNKMHPPEAWELEWDRRIQKIQGNSNPYISEYACYCGNE